MCGNDFITIAIIEDFFKYYNVPVESLHLANKSCRARKQMVSDVPHYIVRTSKEQYAACGGKAVEVSERAKLFSAGFSPHIWSCLCVSAAVEFTGPTCI